MCASEVAQTHQRPLQEIRGFLLHSAVQVIKHNDTLTSGKILWLEMQANTASIIVFYIKALYGFCDFFINTAFNNW